MQLTIDNCTGMNVTLLAAQLIKNHKTDQILQALKEDRESFQMAYDVINDPLVHQAITVNADLGLELWKAITFAILDLAKDGKSGRVEKLIQTLTIYRLCVSTNTAYRTSTTQKIGSMLYETMVWIDQSKISIKSITMANQTIESLNRHLEFLSQNYDGL